MSIGKWQTFTLDDCVKLWLTDIRSTGGENEQKNKKEMGQLSCAGISSKGQPQWLIHTNWCGWCEMDTGEKVQLHYDSLGSFQTRSFLIHTHTLGPPPIYLVPPALHTIRHVRSICEAKNTSIIFYRFAWHARGVTLYTRACSHRRRRAGNTNNTNSNCLERKKCNLPRKLYIITDHHLPHFMYVARLAGELFVSPPHTFVVIRFVCSRKIPPNHAFMRKIKRKMSIEAKPKWMDLLMPLYVWMMGFTGFLPFYTSHIFWFSTRVIMTSNRHALNCA